MWWIILGGSSKKWGFALDWMLSGNRGNTKIACLNSYLMGRKVSVTQISQERGMFDHFCGLDHVFVLVSAQTWLWRRLFFFSGLHPVYLMWCSVTSQRTPQPDSESQVQILGSPRPSSQSSPAIKGCSSFSQTPFPRRCTYTHHAQICILFQRSPEKVHAWTL